MKKNIIFLDIDGVLNSPYTYEKIGAIKGVSDYHMSLLKKIVDYTDSDIVLTSTWKNHWKPELKNDGKGWGGSSPLRYGRYLNLRLKKFGLEIADKTEEDSWNLRARGILRWLAEHPATENFIILDDEDFWWEENGLGANWVDTDFADVHRNIGEGLTPEKVDEILESFDTGRFCREAAGT